MPFDVDSLSPEIAVTSEIVNPGSEEKQSLTWFFERRSYDENVALFMEVNTPKSIDPDKGKDGEKAKEPMSTLEAFKMRLKRVEGVTSGGKPVPHSDELVEKLLASAEVRVPALLKFQDMLTGKYIREAMEKNS